MNANSASVTHGRDTLQSERQSDSEGNFLTLGHAGRLVPGGKSANTIWRWCRRGVLARNGERIKLEHVRVGGMILTTRKWLSDYGTKLAAADAAHFDRVEQPRSLQQVPNGRDAARKAQLRQVDEELSAAGI